MGPKQVSYPTDNFDDLALINYTSGTTSAPKGVMLTYRNISSTSSSDKVKCPTDLVTRWLMLPMAHMYGMAFEYLYQLAGGTQVFSWEKYLLPRCCWMPWQRSSPI